MKKIYLAALTLISLAMSSCQTNESALTPNDFSDYAFTCSGYLSGSENINYVDLNSVVSFMNLSKGALAQYWEVEEGANFVTADYPDFEPGDYSSVIIDGQINDETTAFVYFGTTGEYTVKLATLFSEPKTYKHTSTGQVFESYYSEELGGYVIRTDFRFMVLGDVNAALSLYKADGSKILSLSADDTLSEGALGSITITEGESLTLVYDEIISNPNLFTYNFKEGAPEVVETLDENGMPKSATITYRTPGKAFSMGSVEIQRTLLEEYEGMKTSKASKNLPLFITVNEKPYEASPIDLVEGSLVATTNSLSFNVESLNKVVADKDAAADFSLKVNNAAVGVVDQPIAISKVAVSSDFKTITLSLGEMLYSNDEISLSFSGDGIDDGESTSLTAFEAQSVRFEESVVDSSFYGFETPGAAWKSSKTPDAWSISSENVASGSSAVKYSNVAAFSSLTVYTTTNTNTVNFDYSQKYTIKYKIFITEDSAIGDATLLQFIFGHTYTLVKFSITDFERGQWLEKEVAITNGAVSNGKLEKEEDSIQLGLVKPDVCTIYLDDIDVLLASERP